MTKWSTVILELLALTPTIIGWLRERSQDKKEKMLKAINEREDAWKNGDASRILNSVRSGM
jgi:hypothetical protein